MVEIFLVQFLVAALGAASTALADRSYRNARINPYVHSLWISGSIAVICMPVSIWICCVFLGSGLFGLGVAGMLVGAVFFWVHRNLRQLAPLPKSEPYPLTSRPVRQRDPPGIESQPLRSPLLLGGSMLRLRQGQLFGVNNRLVDRQPRCAEIGEFRLDTLALQDIDC